jgi:sterol 3beta-glucosyltransferase
VVQGVIPYRGHLIVSPRFLCFWRRATFGRDIKVCTFSRRGQYADEQYRFKSSDVKGVVETSAVQIGYHGLALHIAGHHDLKLEFRFKASRTEVSSLCEW